MKKLKLIGLICLLYSCTPNVNNTIPTTNQSIKPSPSSSSIPVITPSITISTPKITKNIKEIRVYADDGTILANNSYYRMLLNETKKFITEVIYEDGSISKENVIWNSNNKDIILNDNLITLKSNVYQSKITLYSKENPSFIFSFYLVLTEIYKKPIYDEKCKIIGYLDMPISRYSTQDISTSVDILVRATFNGKVFDPNGVTVSGAIVTAKGIDCGVTWVGEAQETIGGSYVFRNAPPDSRISITVTKDGWTTRTRNETLTSNLQGDPLANVFDFSGVYAIQDEPEITSLKVNGKQVLKSSSFDEFLISENIPKNSKPTPEQMSYKNQLDNIGNVPSLTGINSDNLEVEMIFSEPIKIADIQNYFRVTSLDSKEASFIIDYNTSGVEFVISEYEKKVTFKTNKAILSNKGGDEKRYLIDFTQPFRDKTDKPAINRRYFRFSPSQINDFVVFSVKNN